MKEIWILEKYLASSTHNWSEWRGMMGEETPWSRELKRPSEAKDISEWKSGMREYWKEEGGEWWEGKKEVVRWKKKQRKG